MPLKILTITTSDNDVFKFMVADKNIPHIFSLLDGYTHIDVADYDNDAYVTSKLKDQL